jgi:serine/threonine protein kinase
MNKNEAKRFLESHGYIVHKFLGEGAFSKVFKCKNPQNQLVAAKVICASSDQEIQMEVKAAKEIEKAKPLDFNKYQFEFSKEFKQRAEDYYKYLNVPTVKEVAADGVLNVVIEAPLVDDDTWSSIIESARDRKVLYAEYKKLAIGVLKALIVLNARGLAHYDIKPANIFQCTSPGGLTKYSLGDFGLLCETLDPEDGQDGQDDYRRRGTPFYAAPEILRGVLKSDQIKKVDVYSLGVTLFEMYLTKVNCIRLVNNMPQTIKKLQTGTYDPGASAPIIKQNFFDFLKLCTKLNPSQRPTPKQALSHAFLG